MDSLSKRIEKRMNDTELNRNFTKKVTKEKNVTDEDEQTYQQAHKEFQKYMNNKK